MGIEGVERSAWPHVLDVKDIQQILGISRNNAYKLVGEGHFHIVKIGRRIKIPRDVFFDWLEGKSAATAQKQ